MLKVNPSLIVTFGVLLKNIELINSLKILPICIGVSDHFGEWPLYWNDNGNRVFDIFAGYANDKARRLMVHVQSLLSIVAASWEDRIGAMKIAIESFEDRLLMRFLAEAANRL